MKRPIESALSVLTQKTQFWAGSALDLIYPRQCQFCADWQRCTHYSFICDRCLDSVDWIDTPSCERCGLPFPGTFEGPSDCPNCQHLTLSFDRAVSFARFRGLVREVIHRLKYNRQLYWEPVLRNWIQLGCGFYQGDKSADLAIPVPLHPIRHREREFNQSEILASVLSREWSIPLCTNELRRVRKTGAQADLNRRERMRNLEGSFNVCNPLFINGKRIILVDDIFTTGATVHECSRVLKQAGAVSVLVFTLCRG